MSLVIFLAQALYVRSLLSFLTYYQLINRIGALVTFSDFLELL